MSVATISGSFDADLAALIRAYEQEGHSVFRPSAASRWMACPGSVIAEIKANADRAGMDAAYGTVAHAIAEEWLRNGKRPKIKLGSTREERGFVITIDAEMLSYIQQYVEWCQALGPGELVEIEKRVDFSDLTPLPNQGGTADHFHIKNGVLTITDLKFGTAVRVYAKGNKQARLYAYGAWREWEGILPIERIVIRICQPRLDVFETWEITLDDLMAFAADAKRAAHEAWSPDAKRRPDPDGCRFCKVQASCPAMVKLAERMADDILSDLTEPLEVVAETVSVPRETLVPRSDPDKLSTEELALVLRWRGVFDAWFRTVHNELMQRGEDGTDLREFGWKIKEGRTNRTWVDESEAEKRLLDLGLKKPQLYTQRMISPKQATDLLRVRGIKPSVISDVVVQPPGKRALVTTDDGDEGLEDAADDILG